VPVVAIPGAAWGDPMISDRLQPAVRVTAVLVATLAIAAYAWWATGLHAFTVGSYVAVGLPVAPLVAVVLVDRPDDSDADGSYAGGEGPEIGLRSAFPWLLLLAIAIGLEAWGLALGGRSTSVPTFSTVVDHAMAWHVVRFVLFCGWLAVGWAAVIRASLRSHRVFD
jgi:hypothetical protein